ncbi:MAG: protein kinase domain-containing protein [Planctomycetota bacterium]|jgi:serine/threonine protein kinase
MAERPTNIYYLRDRWLKGPVTKEDLGSLLESGAIDEKTPAWSPTQRSWAAPVDLLQTSSATVEFSTDAVAEGASGVAGREWARLPSPRNMLALRLAKEQELITAAQTDRIRREMFKSPDPGADVLADLQSRGWITATQRSTIEAVLDQDSAPKLIGGYEIVRELGTGGMGTTYLARQISMDRLVALKVLLARHNEDRDYIRRFEREGKMAARLNHEVIATAYEVGEVGGKHFISMEYAEGRTVGEIIEQDGPLSEEEAVRIVVQVCRGLQHAHEHDMVHRDVKPDNIIVKANGHVKLVDMGLAKSTRSGKSTLTQTGLVVCTPDYASPEQSKGKRDLDIRADIYSLGCVLFEMLTGSAPYKGSTLVETVNMHANDPFPSVKDRRAGASDRVSAVIGRMTEKVPEDRYQTPREVIEDLASGGKVAATRRARRADVKPVAEQLDAWEPAGRAEILLLPEWREYVHLVALKLDERLESAHVDPEFQGYVQTVFGELVSNAFDHGCKGMSDGVVKILMELNQAFFSLEVDDPGPGFPAQETLARIKKEPLARQRRRGIIQVASIADITYSPKGNYVKAVLYRKSEGAGVFPKERDGILFVEIKGKGDLALVESFKRWVDNYDASTPRRVCLMVRTKWVSSLFVGTVGALNSKLSENGSAFSVWVEHQSCYRIMQSLGITLVVHAYTSLDEAELALRYADLKGPGAGGRPPAGRGFGRRPGGREGGAPEGGAGRRT